MVKLAHAISSLEKCKILVIGDFMLDTYTIGKVNRISPEAPVAVLQVHHEKELPGGAGNVVLNLVSLGADVVVVGRIGDDHPGMTICNAFKNENINIDGLCIEKHFNTPVKNRVIADNQQLIRLDYEQIVPLSEHLEQQVIEMLPKLMQGIAAVAISDYGKGLLSHQLLNHVIQQANSFGVPIIADPKGKDFGKYNGVTMLKPNLSEAYAAANMPSNKSLDLVAEKLLELSDIKMLMITRAKDGISVFSKNESRQDFPVVVKDIKDVTGAGDTVLAMITYGLANRLSINESVQLSNIAAGIAIERVGCARVSLSDIVRRLIDSDSENKIFDDEHLFILTEALKGRSFHLLGISGRQGMSSPIFAAINQLGKDVDTDLVIYFLDTEVDEGFLQLLASMQVIKLIIIQHSHLKNLCEIVQPKATYSVQDSKLVCLS